MPIDAWPEADLPHGFVRFEAFGGGRGLGGAIAGPPSVAASTYGPLVRGVLTNLPVTKRGPLLAARALQSRLASGAAPIMLPACLGGLTPQIAGQAAMEAVLGAAGDAGGDEIVILLAGGFRPLRGGEWFSATHDQADIGRRAYMVAELVDNADPAQVTVRIVPRLRAELAEEAVLDFVAPTCPMRLVDGFDLPTELGRFSAIEATFEEWFPANIAAGLGPITLSPSTIVEGSPEDTFVGRLFGMTAGSTVTLIDTAGGRFKLVDESGVLKIYAGGVATEYATATSHDITVRETLVSAPNSPRDSVLTIDVTPLSGDVPHRYWAIPITLNAGHGTQMGLAAVELAETPGGADASAGFVSLTVIAAGSDLVGSEIGKAFDGNPATNWMRNGATSATIVLDYSADETNWPSFADLRLTCHSTDVTLGARAFGLSWSDDAVAYTSVATRDIGYSQVKGDARSVLETDPVDGTYRCNRLLCVDNNGGITIALGEIAMAGLALPTGSADDTLGRDIASSTNSGSFPASNAHDGNPGSSWQTSLGFVEDQWIGRISPGPVAVSQITATCSTGVADPTGRAPRNVKRQVSHKNNNDWVDVASASWTDWFANPIQSV